LPKIFFFSKRKNINHHIMFLLGVGNCWLSNILVVT
jgi:hypothetical protein